MRPYVNRKSPARGESGDNMHLAVGQGELSPRPLQMAVAYSTLANAYEQRRRLGVVDSAPGHGNHEPSGGPGAGAELPAQRTCT